MLFARLLLPANSRVRCHFTKMRCSFTARQAATAESTPYAKKGKRAGSSALAARLYWPNGQQWQGALPKASSWPAIQFACLLALAKARAAICLMRTAAATLWA
ncbi:hypothetical protein NPIL_517051 [Nephila pilipes]|uniref:Uncharacterized protein n=1 Tax=Nephila pilipes TaxID=299642 RepID=A0A8X6MCM2_NEPPI|nr:hypothetical protein NPIL_517051 [Nephila pilipes]